MPKIHSSIACNLDSNILLAALPLFDVERVQAIEWSFDSLFNISQIPDWFEELIQTFSDGNCLLGHGVFFSLFSGKWTQEQAAWLDNLKTQCQRYNFEHITEHFGFMTGENFHQGAPISIPFTPAILALGQDRLKRIQEACACPVGLENLAIAYGLEEVKKQGVFLDALLEPINGFLILDLHNLYCQIHNFEIPFETIIQWYPLERVREIHISGGSWEEGKVDTAKKIRRDTHDDSVPEDVFFLLEKTLAQCPNLKYVVLEQIGTGLKTDASRQQFQRDFYRMDFIVEKHNAASTILELSNTFLPKIPFIAHQPLENLQLHQQQIELSHILETATSYMDAKGRLAQSSLANTAWRIENWNDVMLNTVLQIAQKWK